MKMKLRTSCGPGGGHQNGRGGGELYLKPSPSWFSTVTVCAARASSAIMQFSVVSVAASAIILILNVRTSLAGFAASDAIQHTEHQQEHEHHEAKPYHFGYGVVSHKHGVDFGQQENSDGHTVTGHYRVKLPDGRTQVVTYTADWNKGYNAHVEYEGHAAHPQTYQHQEVAAEHGGLTEGVSLGSAGYASGESYGAQEAQGQLEHSSGY